MNAAIATPDRALRFPFRLRCLLCGSAVPDADANSTNACSCGFAFRTTDGILRALAPERAEYFRRFQKEYGDVRAREGRGASEDAYYLGLPFEDCTGHNMWQWSIRAKTYLYFESRILSAIERRAGLALKILDIGAGNGWLSYRLSLRGHRCAAVDIVDNAWDGLGACSHYLRHLTEPFTVVQAEMDRLPLADSEFDVAIFNASFHYSTDYIATIREALRCLRPDGDLLVLDTPYYHRDESGQQMLRERHAQFEKQYGFRSDSIPSLEYVTGETLTRLAAECRLRWDVRRPWYGWAWAMRPWKARWRRRREPSKFYVLWGKREA